MRIFFLFATVVLIWGSTWSIITYQLGVVAEEVSVAYRFAIASALLFAYGRLSGRQLGIAFRDYPLVIIQGALMFSANYLFTYYAINYITSGLVAVIFTLMVVSNAFMERFFFKRAIERRLLLASLFGVAGIVCLFWPEVTVVDASDRSLYGMLLALVAVLFASLGNMAAVAGAGRNLPVVAVNAHGMAWGALTSTVVAILTGREFLLPIETAYISSLLYLAVFGSAIAFGGYLALLRTIGSARAAYTAVLFPPVALLFSTVLEDYRWTVAGMAGIVLIVAGNWLALTRTRRS